MLSKAPVFCKNERKDGLSGRAGRVIPFETEMKPFPLKPERKKEPMKKRKMKLGKTA
jgi:hypothetical protein